ncbi:ParM/StbA family protein [Clostridium tarantellae]|nr:ParM/StbA family protein [Clostridium tarantellae]
MIQNIGLDIGRGYVKAYSKVGEMVKQCCFKSVVGIGRELDFSLYENPIYVEVNGENYFAGMLAEKEGYTPTRNSRDSKTSVTVEKLMCAALNEVAIEDDVKLMIGVPNKLFKKVILNEVIEKYKDKTIKIKDKIQGGYKNINILDVKIFREGDAALLWEVKDKNKNDKPQAMVTVGFRTTELSYFDIGLKFNDKRSKTIELGNRDALVFVQKQLEDKGIMKDLHEIDSSKDYDTLKKIAYDNLAERISQDIEDNWINLNEMDVYVAGGTALNMNFDKTFKVVDEPQMTTAKGLYLLATRVFK